MSGFQPRSSSTPGRGWKPLPQSGVAGGGGVCRLRVGRQGVEPLRAQPFDLSRRPCAVPLGSAGLARLGRSDGLRATAQVDRRPVQPSPLSALTRPGTGDPTAAANASALSLPHPDLPPPVPWFLHAPLLVRAGPSVGWSARPAGFTASIIGHASLREALKSAQGFLRGHRRLRNSARKSRWLRSTSALTSPRSGPIGFFC